MWIIKLLDLFIVIDLAVILVTIFAFSYVSEKKEFGDYSIVRGFNITHQQEAESAEHVLTLKDNEQLKRIELRIDGVHHTMEYRVLQEETVIKQLDVTAEYQIALIIFSAVLILEIITVLGNLAFGIFAIRRKLKPLDTMAQMANELGNQTIVEADDIGFDEDKVHNLEDAIAKITPDGPNGVLHTTDEDLKGLEVAINGLLDRMRAAYKQQTRFVSDASHELRTPIAVIQGYVNMLDRWGKQDETVLNESIEAIKNESEHMKKLVEQLLFLARGDSGRNRFTLEKTVLNDIVHEVYEESLMIDEGHIYKYVDSKNQIEVIADVSMLKQTIRILTDNAAKYTPQKQIIKLGCGYDEKNRPMIYVQDNGIGMEKSALDHVFERFYRADEARESKTGGTGLGLSIAKWIIDRHGGFFEIKSEKDIGTRISIILPQEQVEAEWQKGQTTTG
jgi:signal transduction histidine kinase